MAMYSDYFAKREQFVILIKKFYIDKVLLCSYTEEHIRTFIANE